mmetsp:Transcript_89879/g.279726  ORF Transcript_89879/g.279726 Transcript_89879/m.279726 type:complete len:253 (-) Transcript_89879:21-779(-)
MDVVVHPAQGRLLVEQAQVLGDVRAREGDPAQDAQAEVEVDEDGGVLLGLRDAVAPPDRLEAPAVLVDAAVEVDDDGHLLVPALGDPDVQVQAVLALRIARARPDAGAAELAGVVHVGDPGLGALGGLEAPRRLRIRHPAEEVVGAPVQAPDRPEPSVGHRPLRRLAHRLAERHLPRPSLGAAGRRLLHLAPGVVDRLLTCPVHVHGALHEGGGVVPRLRRGAEQGEPEAEEERRRHRRTEERLWSEGRVFQ